MARRDPARIFSLKKRTIPGVPEYGNSGVAGDATPKLVCRAGAPAVSAHRAPLRFFTRYARHASKSGSGLTPAREQMDASAAIEAAASELPETLAEKERSSPGNCFSPAASVSTSGPSESGLNWRPAIRFAIGP